MGSTDRFTGYSMVLTLDGTVISGLREVSIDKMIDTVESTAGSESGKSYLATTRSVTGSFKYVSEGTAGDQAHIGLLKTDGTIRTFKFGPEGSLAGTHMLDAGSVRITKHSVTATYDGLVEMTCDYQSTGNWVSDRESATW